MDVRVTSSMPIPGCAVKTVRRIQGLGVKRHDGKGNDTSGQSSVLLFFPGRFQAGFNIRRTPGRILGRIQHHLTRLGRDSSFATLHGTFGSGFSTHGTPEEGTHHSLDSTAYFAMETVRREPHRTGFYNPGIPRHVLHGNQQPCDTTERDIIIAGCH